MTIAVVRKYPDRIEIATDGRASTSDRILSDNSEKIFHIGRFSVCMSGSRDIIDSFRKHLLNKDWIDYDVWPIFDYFDTLQEFHKSIGISLTDPNVYLETILISTESGIIYRSIVSTCFEIEEFCAIGNGEEMALGALEMGATPKEAVDIVCRHLPHCGGKIIRHTIQLS